MTASPGYNSGTIDHWPDTDNSTWDRTHALQLLSSAETYRWWRIDISGLSGLSYYQAGRLYIDAAFNPSRTVDIGATLGRTDTSIRADSQGATFIRPRKQKRTMGVQMSLRTESEAYDDHLDLQRRIGTGRDLLVCMEGTDYTMERLLYCTMDAPPQVGHGQYSSSYTGNIHDINYSFTELEHP